MTKLRTSTIGMVALALGVSACTPEVSQWSESQSPKEIEVTMVRESVNVAVSADGSGVMPADAERLSQVVAASEAPELLHVTLFPVSGLGTKGMSAVTTVLRRNGVLASNISRTTAPGEGTGDVQVVMDRYVAIAPNCPDWTRANINDNSNAGSSNFGCATANNLMLMVADPRDLVVGRDIGPARGDTAAGSVKRYRNNELKGTDAAGRFDRSSLSDVAQ